MNNCGTGADLLLLLSEDDNFGNAVIELGELYIAGDPNDDWVNKRRMKLLDEFNSKLVTMQGSGDGDDRKKRLREALNRAVTEKKWWKVAAITAAGVLWAFRDSLYRLLYHENP